MATETTAKSWVQKTPGVYGGDACIRKMRIPVFGLVQLRHQGASDQEILESYPSLTQDDLAVAWEYYAHNQEEIERAIRENEEA